MFLTGAIGIKIAIAKILGIADDVSKLISFLLNSKNCYTEPLTHLWLLLLMALIAIHFCCLLKVFVPWRNVRSIFTTRGWDASAPFPLTLSDTFFSPVVLHLLWYPSNILLGFKRLCKRYESFQQTLVHVRRANEASRYQMCLSPSLIPRKKKKTMPFLTVDTIIGNQAFRNGRCHTCSRLGLD